MSVRPCMEGIVNDEQKVSHAKLSEQTEDQILVGRCRLTLGSRT